MSQRRTYDLILVGGGVIGLSIAWECAQAGLSVSVIEANQIGRGSSWAGAGILPSGATIKPLDPLEQLRALSHSLHESWAAKLLEQTGIDNEYRRSGGLYVARSAGEKATLAANRFWWNEHGIPHELLDPDFVSSEFPGLTSNGASESRNASHQYWWLPNDCCVRNPRHIQALRAACLINQVTIIETSPVVDIVRDGDWKLICETVDYRAKHVCLTAGAWTVKLLSKLGVKSGIMPVRGQMLLYRFERKPFPCVINEGHRYLVPREDGHVLAGSCEEEVGYVAETTEGMIAELKTWAESLYPPLKENPIVSSWAGLRPGSFDSYPYLGPVPGMRDMTVAAGHFRHGLHWSTGTALLMRQLICGEATSMELSPFHVCRKFGTLSA